MGAEELAQIAEERSSAGGNACALGMNFRPARQLPRMGTRVACSPVNLLRDYPVTRRAQPTATARMHVGWVGERARRGGQGLVP